MLRIALAVIHLLSLAVGLPAVLWRAERLRSLRHAPGALRGAFAADNAWGISALLFAGSGLWRLFAATEKATSYYTGNTLFWSKMGLLGAILLLELWPMVTLIRWRIADARGTTSDPTARATVAGQIARISVLQGALLVAMVVTATMMARGYGATR
jgi:putative membrane protein